MAPRARAPRLGGLLLLAWLCAACAVPPFAAPRFRIAVVDATTGRGIPAVELRPRLISWLESDA